MIISRAGGSGFLIGARSLCVLESKGVRFVDVHRRRIDIVAVGVVSMTRVYYFFISYMVW